MSDLLNEIKILESIYLHLSKSFAEFSEDDNGKWDCMNPEKSVVELHYGIEILEHHLNQLLRKSKIK